MYAGIPLINSIVVIPQAQISALKSCPASEAKICSLIDFVSMKQNYDYRFDIAMYLSSQMRIIEPGVIINNIAISISLKGPSF